MIDSRITDYIDRIKDQRQKQGQHFPSHKYIHHGLSSQALLFNLLGIVIVGKHYDILDDVLVRAGIVSKGKVNKVELEIEDRDIFNERRPQPTSIDLVIHTNSNEHYFVEFKFTEAEFGGCSLFRNGDCDGENPSLNFEKCWLHYLKCTYWVLMDKHGLLTQQVSNETRCPFMDLYQAYRVLLFSLEKKGEFILMYDNRNPAFYVETPSGPRGLYSRFLSYLPQVVRSKCHLISTQDVFDCVSSKLTDQWVTELRGKYF